MSIQVTIVNEVNLDGSLYKYFIYKKLDYISTNQLISIDPRGNSDFIDVPIIHHPLGYEYLSDGITKFVVMALYKVFEDNTIQLSAVFRSEDYYDSSLFTKMTINIILTGIIKDHYTINQIKVQLLDHNNQPYIAHGIDPDTPGGLVAKSLIATDPNKIHYNKDLTRLIKSASYINPKTNIEVKGSNVIVDNDLIRKVAYVNTLEDGETPVIYNNDFVGQIIESANQLDAGTMKTANLLYCPPGGAFIDNEIYPELASEIGDRFLYDYKLYAKIVGVGGAVSEHKYSDLTPEQIPLVVEEYYVSTPATPQENKTKLPAKEFLGPNNNVHYYIKFATSLNTINKLLIHDVNGVTPNAVNNSIQLTTTNIPQGDNLYYHDNYLDPIRTRLDEIEGVIPANIVSSINTILPDADGKVTLTASNIGAASEQYVKDQISSLNLNKFLTADTQVNNSEISHYNKVPDPNNPNGGLLVDRFTGFHLDSKDIYYEKDINKNPNDKSYTHVSIWDKIEHISSVLSSDRVLSINTLKGNVILKSNQIDLNVPINKKTNIQDSLVDLDSRLNAIDPVTSVNTKTGAVVLVESDIPSIGSTYQKLIPTSDVNINNNKLLNVATPTTATDGVNKSYVDSVVKGYIKNDGSIPFTKDINANSNKVIGVTTPTNDTDASNKKYVDDSIMLIINSLVGTSMWFNINSATNSQDKIIDGINIWVKMASTTILKQTDYPELFSKVGNDKGDGTFHLNNISTGTSGQWYVLGKITLK